MIQYLIIVLDDISTSYCHYDNPKTKKKLMPLEVLKKGIVFGMKENLMIQFVYPDYDLPQEYKEAINEIDHSVITSIDSSAVNGSDVIVINGLEQMDGCTLDAEKSYVLRLKKEELFSAVSQVEKLLENAPRLNIVITDVESFTNDDFIKYSDFLAELSGFIKAQYLKGCVPQLNSLTDRMVLNKMNNCDAGWKSVTLAPNGKLYVCPAFYFSGMYAIGDLNIGLDVKNPQLYRLSYAPLCRNCDAYQCRRCIWLNINTTLEVNTPSHEQCVLAHLERNASRDLLTAMQDAGIADKSLVIKELEYLDPFEKFTNK